MSPSSSRQFKDRIYEQLGRLGKAMAAPKRLELLDLLCQGPRTVEALAEHAAISTANASQHLQILRTARLVEAEKKGLYVEYRLADQQVSACLVSMRSLAEARLAEVEQVRRAYLMERGALEAVPRSELLRRVRAGEVTVIDVRPPEEFRAGHLPGALSVPLAELKRRLAVALSIPLPDLQRRLAELPRDRDVVAYCRGPYCVMAIEAVQVLRKKGFTAHRLEDGVADWRARGWRVETGGAVA